ncbi:MAG: carbohydrate ABC transporter permease [Candidatus Omnitrophica bacterium]|nr:carbohydrate ABC transporter permease [Candidatus Omnitrophota bacterium]
MTGPTVRWEVRIRRWLGEAGAHLLCGAVAVTCLFPLLWMLSSSLKTQATVFTDLRLLPAQPQWQNYATAWTQGHFGSYFWNSVRYTISVVAGVVLVASLAAYAFARLKFRGKELFYALLLATMFIPIPGSFIAIYVLLTKLHLINTQLGYILPQINGSLALGIFILRPFFEGIPRELEESAKIDGCGRVGVFRHIMLPLARPALAVVVIMTSLAVWNEYLLALLIFSSQALMPLQRGLMVFQGAHLTQYPLLMAGMIITIVPIVAVYLVMQRHIVKGVTAGAVKG